MELDRIKMQVREGLGRLLPRLSQYKYALIVLLVGILLLYAGGGARDRPESNQPSGTEEAGFDLDSFEQTGESVYASNIRESESGSESGSYESTLSTVSDGSYGEQPVRIKETCPIFRGAVVLCDGAGASGVRLAVTEAVGAVCGLGADKISVIQMGTDR